MTFTPSLHTNVVGSIYDNFVEPTLTLKEDEQGKATESLPVRVLKLSAHTAAVSILAVASLVESVVRAVIFAVAKSITFFVPKQWAEKIDKKAILPLYLHASYSFMLTSSLATRIGTNFLGSHKREKTERVLGEFLSGCFYNSISSKIFFGHINGVSVDRLA